MSWPSWKELILELDRWRMKTDNFFAKDMVLTARFVDRTNGRFYQALAYLISRTGDSWLWAVICAVMVWQKGLAGWLLVINLLATAGLIAVFKGIIKRPRPHTTGREIAQDKYSFPSGHSARTGAMATVLALLYPQWLGVFVLWAVAVALSRVVRRRHFLGDVFVGLMLGSFVSLFIYIIWHYFFILYPA